MPIPWMPLLLTGAGMLGKKLFGGESELDFGVTPEAYKDQLTLSDADLGTMRRQSLENISMLNKQNVAGIKQVGAARRLPSGAIGSQIAGASQQMARGASAIEPQLSQAQQQSYAQYMNLMQPYSMMRAQQGSQGQMAGGQFMQEGMGTLAKIAMLWQGGYFDNQSQGSGGNIQPVNPAIRPQA